MQDVETRVAEAAKAAVAKHVAKAKRLSERGEDFEECLTDLAESSLMGAVEFERVEATVLSDAVYEAVAAFQSAERRAGRYTY